MDLHNYPWIEEYCSKKPGFEQDYKEEWQAWRFLLKGKMFAMIGGDKQGSPIITLKLEPAYGDFLRREYPGQIEPGYYMNKTHWNSLHLDSSVPDEVVRKMLDDSHTIVLASLPKKVQQQILEQ